MKHDKLSAHLLVDRYDDFQLTPAIRPGLDLDVIPRQGYRLDQYCDHEQGLRVPVLAASISAEHLFEIFLALLEPLGETVDIVLETSHAHPRGGHQDLVREGIDLPVLMSHLYDFEDLLLGDGCTGLAVIAQDRPMEVQFDEHKLLLVYARQLRPFERILRGYSIARLDDLKLLTEAEHLHHSKPEYQEAFDQLVCRLGVGEFASWVGG